MNFHKTIGFLATLLLMLGIGVPDSFAQNEEGTMTVEFTESRVDAVKAQTSGGNNAVQVKVTLNPAPDAATTVTVPLSIANTTFTITDDPMPDPVVALSPSSVDVTVGTNGMGTSSDIFVVDTNATDYIDTATLVATVAAVTGITVGDDTYDYSAFTRSIPVRSRHRIPASTKSITLEAGSAVPSFNANSATGQPVTVTVTLAQAPGQDDADADITVTVSFFATHVAANGHETTNSVGISPATLDIVGDAKEGETTLTVTDAPVGTVRVVAGAAGYRSSMIEIPVIDRDAEDVQGFRVVIASPGDKQWVGIRDVAEVDEIEVHVMRVSRHAYDWTQFTSITVSLRDTTDATDGTLDYTDLSTLTQADGSTLIVDPMIVTNFNAASDGTIETNDDDVTYDRATDKFVFKFKPLEDDNASPAAASYKGVYAVAIFAAPSIDATADPPVNIINSNDAKKNVFSSESLLAGVSQANKKVGDGKLIQVDVVRPVDSPEFEDSDLTVTVGGDPADRNTMVRIGQKIEVELTVSGTVRFRDGNIRLALVPVDAAAANGRDKTFVSETFDADDIADASGGSLDISLTVAAGTFALKARGGAASQRGFNRNTGKRLANNASFEVDGLPIVAKLNTIDQAGNVSATGVSSVEFEGDSRKPVISVIHPASGDHFSAIYENERALEEYDDHLMPLVVRVDEDDLKELYIFAPGTGRVEKDDKVDLTDTSISNVIGQATANTVGDTTAYNTTALKYPTALENKRTAGNLPGGAAITLRVVAIDAAGNKTVMNISNVTHDEVSPKLTTWFPKQSLLEEEDGTYLINNATRHPTLTLPEAVDSIAVTYSSRGEVPIVETVSGTTAKGDKEVTITDAFDDGRTYTLTIFTRDLAGNVAISGEEELKFSASFANPMANAFKVTNKTTKIGGKESPGVIAGQAIVLEIQAIDDGGTPAAADDRNVYTYKNDMASAVKISAWAGGGAAESVSFSGGGVTNDADNPGYASLNAAGWSSGKRTVHAKSEKALDDITILIQHLDAADAEVLKGSIPDLYVDAADFAKFNVIAYQPDKETGVAVTEVNPGTFELEIIPADKYGNESVKAFVADLDATITSLDSLKLLDNQVTKNANKSVSVQFDGIPVSFGASPPQDDLSLGDNIPGGGAIYFLDAPAGRSSVRVNITIVDDELEPSNARAANVKTQRESFKIVAPLNPMLTLWGPNGEDWTNEESISIPADATDGLMVTVRADGYDAGSMVTFSDGTEATADDDGNASLPQTITEETTLTLSATDGRYMAPEKTWMFTTAPAEPMRMAFTTEPNDAGDPVYLITRDNDTVDLQDYTAFTQAWGKSKGDDIDGDPATDDVQTFLQSDVNDDTKVNLADYTEFVTSWGKTANPGWPAATKPIVLLPGINENAEFSLSLGSERVVAGELVAVDVSLANVEALVSYGFTLNYDVDKFEFVSVAPADEDLLKSTGGETPMFFHRMLADGQVEIANGLVNGTAVSGGGDIVRFVFRVLYEFEDNARFEIANGLVFDPTSLSNPAVVAGVLELQSTPREFALHQNFPNPFNPDTTIKYDLAESSDVTLQIYNVLGQVVRTLVASEAQNAGRYQIRWNGMDDRGVPVSSGVYFYQISADGKFQQVQKLMLLK